jgi:hypothetical protein
MSVGKKKGGSGIVEALWAGTAVFAATKARTYTGFITSTVIYGIVLMIVLAVAAWLMKAIGIQAKEKFTTDEIQCQAGEELIVSGGDRKCRNLGTGNEYKLPSAQTGGPSA